MMKDSDFRPVPTTAVLPLKMRCCGIAAEGLALPFEVSRDGTVIRYVETDGSREEVEPWSSARGPALSIDCFTVSLARCVAEAWLPRPPRGTTCIHHLDGDRDNCDAANLEWANDLCAEEDGDEDEEK